MHALIDAEITIAEMLRAAWPRHTAKLAARAAQGSVATAKAWVQGRTTPSAEILLRMARNNDELRAELLLRLGAHGFENSNSAIRGGVGASVAGGEAGEAGGCNRPTDLNREVRR